MNQETHVKIGDSCNIEVPLCHTIFLLNFPSATKLRIPSALHGSDRFVCRGFHLLLKWLDVKTIPLSRANLTKTRTFLNPKLSAETRRCVHSNESSRSVQFNGAICVSTKKKSGVHFLANETLRPIKQLHLFQKHVNHYILDRYISLYVIVKTGSRGKRFE